MTSHSTSTNKPSIGQRIDGVIHGAQHGAPTSTTGHSTQGTGSGLTGSSHDTTAGRMTTHSTPAGAALTDAFPGSGHHHNTTTTTGTHTGGLSGGGGLTGNNTHGAASQGGHHTGGGLTGGTGLTGSHNTTGTGLTGSHHTGTAPALDTSHRGLDTSTHTGGGVGTGAGLGHNTHSSTAGATGGAHKPTVGQKLAGATDILVGKATHNPAKVAQGEAKKTGVADTAGAGHASSATTQY